MVDIYCDRCEKTLYKANVRPQDYDNVIMWHCKKKYCDQHPTGFDICLECAPFVCIFLSILKVILN